MSDRAAELDLMSDYEAIFSLEAEFPDWMVFRQGRGMWLKSCFARRYGGGAQAEGEDWADLRDQIVRAKARAEAGGQP